MKNYQEKYKKYKSKYLLLAGSDAGNADTFLVDESVRTYESTFLAPSSTNPINNPKFVAHQSAQISFQGIGIPIPITFLLSFYISSQCQTRPEGNDDLKKINKINFIGQGTFNAVYDIGSNKALRLTKTGNDNQDELNGLEIQQYFSHHGCPYIGKVYDYGYYKIPVNLNDPNIISLFQNKIDFNNITNNPQGGVYAVMDRVSGGEFKLRGSEGSKPSVNNLAQLQVFIRQILEALECIHRLGYCHLDIKPQNILVESEIPFKIQLIDFGLAYEIQSRTLRYPTGTRLYMAPEMFEKPINPDNINGKCDIWSLGMLIMEILIDYPKPFSYCDLRPAIRGCYQFTPETINSIKDLYNTDEYDKTDGSSSELTPSSVEENRQLQKTYTGLYDLVNGMLQTNNNDRWTAEACLNSEFITHNI